MYTYSQTQVKNKIQILLFLIETEFWCAMSKYERRDGDSKEWSRHVDRRTSSIDPPFYSYMSVSSVFPRGWICSMSQFDSGMLSVAISGMLFFFLFLFFFLLGWRRHTEFFYREIWLLICVFGRRMYFLYTMETPRPAAAAASIHLLCWPQPSHHCLHSWQQTRMVFDRLKRLSPRIWCRILVLRMFFFIKKSTVRLLWVNQVRT